MIFVTRLLRNPAQMADFCAIFLHKTGFLCKFLSVSFTFLERSDEKIRGRNAKFRAPEFFFRGSNFFFGARTKKSRYRNFFAVAPGPFFFPVGTFSRTRFPCHSVNGRMCAGASHRNPDMSPFRGRIVITADFGPFAELRTKLCHTFSQANRYFCLTNIARHDLRGPVENQAFPCLSAHLSLYLRHTL